MGEFKVWQELVAAHGVGYEDLAFRKSAVSLVVH
jgi:hypothetical protein